MFLVDIIVMLIIVGLLLWLVEKLPIDASIKQIIRVVVIVCIIIWLIYFLVGFLPLESSHYRLFSR